MSKSGVMHTTKKVQEFSRIWLSNVTDSGQKVVQSETIGAALA